ncbi:arabinofuranosidase [Desarmillaria tabescens]|uniref:non-reducing end alpha-L-arabinofuranosidase n=1 Tax=Armillaria tabescens TaxID=1929756 RepID=A0AA39NDM6_ARMTA|nr:arabinofuranosidase [Desarmillaria tabescens]KAK0463671.1 arabinofuranosidase [Desarmillaria tabescens]
MLKTFQLGVSVLGLLVGVCTAQTTVSVSATASHAIPTSLWGVMYEDISVSVSCFDVVPVVLKQTFITSMFSGDGGLYAELLQNRAFQQVTPGTTAALNAWQAINGASLAVIADTQPVSSALPNALHVTIPAGSTGAVGFGNTGYFGIKVTQGSVYTVSFFYRFPTASSFLGNINVGLQTTSGQILASSSISISGSRTSWTQVSARLRPATTPASTANMFTVTVDGTAAAGQTVNFAMFSLFPPTFKNRQNGMRVDIANVGIPNIFGVSGGTIAQRWQWNATLGPLVDRPGRVGDWSYINTDGLGLLEYLTWCEDLNMEPIMAVWAGMLFTFSSLCHLADLHQGFALGGASVPQDQLGPYVQQAIDQIYFTIGDPATNANAALRASLGHPEPFKLKYVEIGNEARLFCIFDKRYTYRWPAFVNALKAEFPDLHYIATTFPFNPVLSPTPTEYDNHLYTSRSGMVQNGFFYDDVARDGTQYFEETATSYLQRHLLLSSINVASSQWHPNLISFDAGSVYLSTSYYAQKVAHNNPSTLATSDFIILQLFSRNRGDEYIPSTLPARDGTLFWTVVRKTSVIPNELIIKWPTLPPVTFSLPFSSVSSTALAQVLTGSATASNTPSTPQLVIPVNSTIATGQTFTYSAPPFSLSVLTLTL